jgi:ABC-2 type transport system permease protein
MFPFAAMPRWAQRLAETLPLTHYLRIVRGLVLRGVDTPFVLAELVPIAVFAVCASIAALLVARRNIA